MLGAQRPGLRRPMTLRIAPHPSHGRPPASNGTARISCTPAISGSSLRLCVQAAIDRRRRQALVQAYFAASNANDWGGLKAIALPA